MTPPSDLDIFILAGQSNMQGYGWLQGSLEPDERVWNFTSAGKWEVAREPLHRLWESYLPVHQKMLRANFDAEAAAISDEECARAQARDLASGAGLGLAFGQAMAAATGRNLGLIPAAHAGTTLEQWDFGRKEEGGDSLYGAMLERVRTALAGGGVLRGLLWYQGTADAFEPAATTYFDRFRAWIEAVRADLGQPDLPVISVQIGRVVVPPIQASAYPTGAWEKVRHAFVEIPQQVPHTATTSAIDLGLCDSIHINTPCLIRLGKRMARLALGADSPRVVSIQKSEAPNGLGLARVVCEGVNGGWKPRQHIGGFEARTESGEVHPTAVVVNAEAAPDDPRNIRILFNAPLTDDSVRIGYGLGLNPYCNAVDEADMPLCAFLPIGISG